jgi:beta-lactam-binding protein with PASTA domain
MARPRPYRFRRPPPPEPGDYERTVEETVPARPRAPFETLWFWLALVGVVVLAVVVVVLLLVRDDDEPRRAGARTVTMPAVVGADHVEAADALERLGLVVTTSPATGPDPAGRVTAQRPTAGTRVRRGEEVELTVSTGTTTLAAAPVPDATGAPARAGRDLIRMAGFTVRTVYRGAPSAEEIGEVLDQEPAAGTRARSLSQVTLFVGR